MPSRESAGPAPDARARTAVRDRADRLVKPIGSLGVLEEVVERWAAATGHPPTAQLTAAHLICAADHGHALRGSSVFEQRVTSQIVAAAARGETAIAVLTRGRGERLLIADLGLAHGTPPGCLDASIRAGTADSTEMPAMSEAECARAVATGQRLAGELIESTQADCITVGEIGIGNTATAAALLSALTGLEPARTVGRGTGMDAQGLARKRALVSRALRRHRHDCAAAEIDPRAPFQALAGVGGLELAAIAGAIHGAHERGLPVVLDGLATGVAALVAVGMRAACGEWLIAGHRSAEPAHAFVLGELGLEPLLDLRLRLGEGSGAVLALALIEQAGRLHGELATFEEARVEGPRTNGPRDPAC